MGTPNATVVTEEALLPTVPALGDVGSQARGDLALCRSKGPVLVGVVVGNAIIEDCSYGLYDRGSVVSFFVRSRKLICYLLTAACTLKGSGVGMDPSRLRAATGGANGNWERSLCLRKR